MVAEDRHSRQKTSSNLKYERMYCGFESQNKDNYSDDKFKYGTEFEKLLV